MKMKFLLVAATAIVFAACGSPYKATDTDGTTVVVAPGNIQTAFTTQYPDATEVVWSNYDQALVPIDWELAGWETVDPTAYVVRFNMNSENYYAWYDKDGNWIGSADLIKDHNNLPADVTKTLNNQFTAYSISSVNREFHGDQMLYEIELKNDMSKVKLLIDGNGNVIKQKTKSL